MIKTYDLSGFKSTLNSYWIDSTTTSQYPKLEDNIEIDIAIVGGGITGVTCGMLLKKAGFNVGIFEKSTLASLASGNTTAKITSQHHLIYDKLISSFGFDAAAKYGNANEEAINFIEDTIKKYNIDCDFKRLPSYMYTLEDSYLETLEKEHKAALSIGLKSKLVDSIPLPISVKAAVSFENQGEFHPRKYILSLAKNLHSHGSYIFENTHIMDLNEGDKITLTTSEGKSIVASKVIIASQFPFYDGFGLYFTKLVAKRSYVIACNIKEEFPNAMFINAEDPGRSLRSINTEGKPLILIGGEGHKTAHGGSTLGRYNNLVDFATDTFTVESIPYHWSTQDYKSLDSVPYIGHLTSSSKDIYVATGFNEWGMSTGTLAAQIIKDLIVDGKNIYEDIFSPSRSFSLESTKNFISLGGHVAKDLLKGKINEGDHDIFLEEDEGKVVSIEGERYGAYKDADGVMHIVDITCTHLGCELKWNDGEKSWDCPCHASRFTYKGEIINGPALRPLHYYGESKNNIDPNIL